ncbi:hypothetical protein CAOG_06565 [Capsaspora owczarzaki ATCC 30864]|uniref:Uncharacterized protein n=1 Tax=Capsaspora owczarzaki (strain ATCC 30864) TaxID=595528 RepID=A0A0D2X4K3_CAPO3|nr:hypothetical protein CAOG_06565 [Capsaspora owczarzaki ATCC 30864]KJE96209.1 hypothetical protein CAOG_006565 [Capsaspora owczarzaki ATCC 30864]|eukprot:XP_004345314.1 hypothetical protein CAOG_06565 [Capsaspora owczarzaki ATCC 30864]
MSSAIGPLSTAIPSAGSPPPQPSQPPSSLPSSPWSLNPGVGAPASLSSSQSTSSSTPVELLGFMHKKGHVRHNWKRRWFTLRNSELRYFKSSRHETAVAVVPLAGALGVARIQHSRPFVFRLVLQGNFCYLFHAYSEEDMNTWINALQAAIQVASNQQSVAAGASATPAVASPTSKSNAGDSTSNPSIVSEDCESFMEIEDTDDEVYDSGDDTHSSDSGEDEDIEPLPGDLRAAAAAAAASTTTKPRARTVIGSSSVDAAAAVGSSHAVFAAPGSSPSSSALSNRPRSTAAPIVSSVAASSTQTSRSSPLGISKLSGSYGALTFAGVAAVVGSGNSPLKCGFLVKKGHIRHNWKMRWFVLHNSRLEYYQTPTDTEPVNVIPLDGCRVDTHPYDKRKRRYIFCLTTAAGLEYRFHASNRDEMMAWTQAIDRAISNFWPSQQQARPASKAEEIIIAMKDHEAGIKLSDKTVRLKTHRNCFSGADAVAWLLSWNFAASREQATQVAQKLLAESWISSTSRKVTEFVDGPGLYRFVDKTSTSTDALASLHLDSDDDDDLPADANQPPTEQATLPAPARPIVVAATVDAASIDARKVGFLLKKGHLRHNWKTRWFVLHKTKPMLEYFSSPKDIEPIGAILLYRCQIGACESKKRPFVFRLVSHEGVPYYLHAPSQLDMEQWISAIAAAAADATAASLALVTKRSNED